MTRTLERPSTSRHDTRADYTDVTTELEKHVEYQPFTNVQDATQWLDHTVKAFGSLSLIHSREQPILDGKGNETGSYRIKDERNGIQDISPPELLRRMGVAAEVKQYTDTRFARNRKGRVDEDKEAEEKKIDATFSLVDENGGVYHFSSERTFATKHGTHNERFKTPWTVEHAEYAISYDTNDIYGYTAEAKIVTSESETQANSEEIENFLTLTSHFKSVLTSKLAALDEKSYKKLAAIFEHLN